MKFITNLIACAITFLITLSTASATPPQFSANFLQTMAVKFDGTLWGWGFNGEGNLGDGTKTSRPVVTRIGCDTDWKSIATGLHTIAIKSDGSLWGWGSNSSGQLGDGTIVSKIIPVRIGTDTDWKMIVTGDAHTLALKADGSLWGWGNNDSGQFGDSTTKGQLSPTRIGSDSWKYIGTKMYSSFGIKSDGTLWV